MRATDRAGPLGRTFETPHGLDESQWITHQLQKIFTFPATIPLPNVLHPLQNPLGAQTINLQRWDREFQTLWQGEFENQKTWEFHIIPCYSIRNQIFSDGTPASLPGLLGDAVLRGTRHFTQHTLFPVQTPQKVSCFLKGVSFFLTHLFDLICLSVFEIFAKLFPMLPSFSEKKKVSCPKFCHLSFPFPMFLGPCFFVPKNNHPKNARHFFFGRPKFVCAAELNFVRLTSGDFLGPRAKGGCYTQNGFCGSRGPTFQEQLEPLWLSL